MMRQRWGLGTVLGVSGIAAALVVACSGNDIPSISDQDREDFEAVYGDDDDVGAAGSNMVAVAGAGGGANVGGRAGFGASGAPPVGGNGGSGAVVGGGGGDDPPCNAPLVVFASSCANPASCHGAGSALGDFGASEAAAMAFIDVPVSFGPTCGLWIDSSNPEESAILQKTQNPVTPGCGQRMPLVGDFLTPEQETCVSSWLSQFGD